MKATYLFVFFCIAAIMVYAVDVPAGFILVEGGTFNNGVAEISLSSFYMGKCEVTQAEYQASTKIKKSFFAGKPNNPVEGVSWFEAIAYCNLRSLAEGLNPCYTYSNLGNNPLNWPVSWYLNNDNQDIISCDWTANGYRLPTEMEWLYAAKGGKQSKGYSYSGSDDWTAVAWFSGSANPNETQPVGTKAPNEIGLHDMSGNVAEWCWDRFGSLPAEASSNPRGASEGIDRCFRGGSFNSNPDYSTITIRKPLEPMEGSYNLGFRICRNAE